MKLPTLKEIDQIRESGFRPQAVGCILNNKKILFFHKKKYNLWQLLQGGIDNQETIEKATIREMTEELGSNFAKSLKINSLIGDDQLTFPSRTQGSRDLKTDDGKTIFMQGKKYFFIAIDTNVTDLNIDETEFDDCKWLDYEQAIELSKKIYQQGKQKITINALNKLHNSDLL
ncbi:MAG: NUDIX domain-containing protein [Candidatus Moranbacteria bacterium]|nr:NUDIX domain-containing protein [Candidatus Moranbacteria bacterium]